MFTVVFDCIGSVVAGDVMVAVQLSGCIDFNWSVDYVCFPCVSFLYLVFQLKTQFQRSAMIELKPCRKCGYEVYGHVNYYGYKNYRFMVECNHCNLVWESRRFNSLMSANNDGAKSWNNIRRKNRRNRG